MEGLLEPVSKEVFVGRANVKQVFRVTKVGTIAGCQVMRGKIVRNGLAKLIRDKQVVYEGKISSLNVSVTAGILLFEAVRQRP